MSRRCTCLAGGVLAVLAVLLAQAPGAFAAQAVSPNAYIVTLRTPGERLRRVAALGDIRAAKPLSATV